MKGAKWKASQTIYFFRNRNGYLSEKFSDFFLKGGGGGGGGGLYLLQMNSIFGEFQLTTVNTTAKKFTVTAIASHVLPVIKHKTNLDQAKSILAI